MLPGSSEVSNAGGGLEGFDDIPFDFDPNAPNKPKPDRPTTKPTTRPPTPPGLKPNRPHDTHDRDHDSPKITIRGGGSSGGDCLLFWLFDFEGVYMIVLGH